MKRIIATFHPQAWANDQAIEIDGAIQFDCTDQVLAISQQDALRIRDDDYPSDNLWKGNPASLESDHSGPFFIEVEQAIEDYYAANALLYVG